jgi:hypothetical protein
MTMKRRHARAIAHSHTTGQSQHEMLLFPWMHGCDSIPLRHVDSASSIEARKWAWIGVGVIAASALGSLGFYGALLVFLI